MTASLVWGLFGTALVAYLAIQSGYVPGLWGIISWGLVLPVLGIIIAVNNNDSALLSFLGYNLVLVPFGVVLGPMLNHYHLNVIEEAFGLTAAVTFVMGLIGTLFPQFFSKLGAALLLSLFVLLMVRIAQMFIPALSNLGLIDYIAAGIFSLYIAYDMSRAHQVTKTFGNAILISVDLYLDIVNLFISILDIISSSED